jgi:hypothetical protein
MCAKCSYTEHVTVCVCVCVCVHEMQRITKYVHKVQSVTEHITVCTKCKVLIVKYGGSYTK